MAAAPIVEARGVSKSFFGNPVLSDVSIALVPGRIHALLGENGAGKSTLINLLSGALVPDSGTIEIDGRSVRSLTPSDARRAGIAVVQQELGLTSELSIAENIGLGAYPRRFGIIDYPALARRAQAVCDLVGVREDLSTPVGRSAARAAAAGRDRQGAVPRAAGPHSRRADLLAHRPMKRTPSPACCSGSANRGPRSSTSRTA